ncbi:MAG: 2,3-bisphosphoglycerate-independent phosphoglycerate mutase [Gammaproteobacteria bacterium AqS3]|nr:2,3-bisphosphoglycerate-independent phosphoglycerate mutase [Gammaproteobacteria bacterium AqS3]
MRNPLVLIVLDGWGYSAATEHNAIHSAGTPCWDRLWCERPHRLISGSGSAVGLPEGYMGNSEVGHLCLGAGRIMRQSLARINDAIASGEWAQNPALTGALDRAVRLGSALHVLGLVSPGGVHSHEDHIFELLQLAADRGVENIRLHAFTDGRDVPPRSAHDSLLRAERQAEKTGAHLASLCGRYSAMDRDQRWERTEAAYDLLTAGAAAYSADTAPAALEMAYQRGESDEFIAPTRLAGHAPIADGDVVIHANFRADRARQLSAALCQEPGQFQGFERRVRPDLGEFLMMTHYADSIPAGCAFPPETVINSLGEWVARHGWRQLRVAETEKYAHVTFFFNGGREKPFHGEERVLIESPRVATYDLQPEMSAARVADAVVGAIQERTHDLIICNFANGDMVGHTGVWEAAITAVETVDGCLERISSALAATEGAQCLITADHGNVEAMFNPDVGQTHTAHTTSPVPLIYLGGRRVEFDEAPAGLADIAPTLLCLAGMPLPEDMQGRVLLRERG